MNTRFPISELLSEGRKIFVLPIGSVEQHGPYLPIDTDLRIAQMLAENLAASLSDKRALLLPAIPFSSSWEHKGLGTIALNISTLAAVLHDIAYSIQTWGIHSFLILVNWHGGNSILGSLATEITARENLPTAVIPSASDIGKAWRTIDITKAHEVHAGAVETSIIQAYWPDLIHQQIQDKDNFEPAIQPVNTQAALQAIGIHHLSSTGIWGAPAEADANKGKELIEQLSTNMSTQVKKLLQLISQDEGERQ
ncbi:creatinine amidohydrolase [Dictyobacter alpinus]|uniref:Creatinine amidohydrolase n=1 Tax=Dictyobacter alpinus TaxID=2014873 RepID=A0A402B972_9CHLR|nr:creatininase family protein [Dictyobacter alpinus]GCE27886.1 creatinine amidohydrolase [Dictyobacter alpinus]